MASKRTAIREFLKVDGKWPKLPVAYDLVTLLLEDGRQISGWHMTGNIWGGRKLKEADEVVGWRFRTEFNYG